MDARIGSALGTTDRGTSTARQRVATTGTFRTGAALLGVGLGGLTDGIVLHQILQWHHLVETRVPVEGLDALRTNVFWDGVFHVATTLTLVVGFALLHRAWAKPVGTAGDGRALLGWVAIGWGSFHVVDQLVLHELFGLHDIRMEVENPGLYNWGFFAVGLGLIALGALLVRRDARHR